MELNRDIERHIEIFQELDALAKTKEIGQDALVSRLSHIHANLLAVSQSIVSNLPLFPYKQKEDKLIFRGSVMHRIRLARKNADDQPDIRVVRFHPVIKPGFADYTNDPERAIGYAKRNEIEMPGKDLIVVVMPNLLQEEQRFLTAYDADGIREYSIPFHVTAEFPMEIYRIA